MKLIGYFRSSAAYRVRIALNLKGLAAEHEYIHLGRGEHKNASFAAINPQQLVPVLVDDDGNQFIQSLAIIEYLEETRPQPPLLPADPAGRARVRALAEMVACEIHPLNNLRVLNYLSGELNISDEERLSWYRHWIAEGLGAVEALLANSPDTGRFCHADAPGMADLCIVPQLFNARRFDCSLNGYPTLLRIEAGCRELTAFKEAAPERQPDAD